MSECTLTVNLPLLADVPPGWTVSLVDTPGYGEHDAVLEVNSAAQKSSIGYVYVVNADLLEYKRYYEEVKKTDKGIHECTI